MTVRVGHGFDVHAFKQGRALVLGGVTIPYDYGLAAHSDGDVVVHALCDALLGAAALGDIGKHFPDSDNQYENIDSRVLLRHVVRLLRERGWRLVNADMTVVAQAPRLGPHIEAMRAKLADDAQASMEQISIKATTTEHLGFAGRGEGVAAYSVVLLETAPE